MPSRGQEVLEALLFKPQAFPQVSWARPLTPGCCLRAASCLLLLKGDWLNVANTFILMYTSNDWINRGYVLLCLVYIRKKKQITEQSTSYWINWSMFCIFCFNNKFLQKILSDSGLDFEWTAPELQHYFQSEVRWWLN